MFSNLALQRFKPLIIGILVSVVLHLVALNIIGKLYFGDGSSAVSFVAPETLFVSFDRKNSDQSDSNKEKNSQVSPTELDSGSVLKENNPIETVEKQSKTPPKAITADRQEDINKVFINSREMAHSAEKTSLIQQAKLSKKPILPGEEAAKSTPEQATSNNKKQQELNFNKPTTAVIQNIEYMYSPKPKYPPLSKRLREEGMVVIKVLVDEEGLPIEFKLHVSSGYPMLDKSALKAVRKWKFKPHIVGSKASVGWAEIPVEFELHTR